MINSTQYQSILNLAILASWLYLFANSTLPNCQVQIAKLSSPCCDIAMTSFPYRQLHINCYLALWLFCQIANSTSPCGLTELVSSCPPNKKFLVCPGLNFFQSAKTSATNENILHTAPGFYFFAQPAQSCPPFPSSLSLSLFWPSGSSWSPFKIHTTL